MKAFSLQANNMTIEYCIRYCQFYFTPYAALQNGNYCYCDYSFGKYSIASLDTACNVSCSGDGNKTCGGYLFNSIFTTIYGNYILRLVNLILYDVGEYC